MALEQSQSFFSTTHRLQPTRPLPQPTILILWTVDHKALGYLQDFTRATAVTLSLVQIVMSEQS
jgi:hypothetical protein